MFYQIFGIVIFIFGLSLIIFNKYWQNHLYGYRTMKKLGYQGPLKKKVNVIIFGIVMMILGIISFFHIGF